MSSSKFHLLIEFEILLCMMYICLKYKFRNKNTILGKNDNVNNGFREKINHFIVYYDAILSYAEVIL